MFFNIHRMEGNKNSIATSFIEKAYNLRKLIFNNVYPYLIEFKIEKGKVFITYGNIFKANYIPFITALAFLTG